MSLNRGAFRIDPNVFSGGIIYMAEYKQVLQKTIDKDYIFFKDSNVSFYDSLNNKVTNFEPHKSQYEQNGINDYEYKPGKPLYVKTNDFNNLLEYIKTRLENNKILEENNKNSTIEENTKMLTEVHNYVVDVITQSNLLSQNDKTSFEVGLRKLLGVSTKELDVESIGEKHEDLIPIPRENSNELRKLDPLWESLQPKISILEERALLSPNFNSAKIEMNAEKLILFSEIDNLLDSWNNQIVKEEQQQQSIIDVHRLCQEQKDSDVEFRRKESYVL